jgi:uncharacterized protein DUF6786
MKFREALELLRDTGNDPILLKGHQTGKEVLCAPSLVGRVLSSTFEAASGESLGWIGVEAIQSGPADPVFNNFGGEDRLWFGPEGSQFGLHFSSQEQTFSNYRVQYGMSSQPYNIPLISPENDFVVMKASIHLQNLAGTPFDIDVERTVRIVDSCPYTAALSGHVEFVGFQTENLVTNRSRLPINSETGLLCCWTPGQHPSKPHSIVVIPFRSGPSSELGEPIREDYFRDLCPGGKFPSDRWWIGNDHALMKADNQCRVKVGVGPKRAENRLGSIDLETFDLTIHDFDLYPEIPYVAPYWRELSPAELREGEAASVYIDGPAEEGDEARSFYELETLSPAMPLKPGESFVHRNRVFHIRGDQSSIDTITRRFLHTDSAEISHVFAERS